MLNINLPMYTSSIYSVMPDLFLLFFPSYSPNVWTYYMHISNSAVNKTFSHYNHNNSYLSMYVYMNAFTWDLKTLLWIASSFFKVCFSLYVVRIVYIYLRDHLKNATKGGVCSKNKSISLPPTNKAALSDSYIL